MLEDYITDNCWLMNGDCLERMKQIPDGSMDMVLTDPPYGTTACKWDSVVPLGAMWAELRRIIKPAGAIVLTASQPFTTVLIGSNFAEFKYTWVWEKEQSHTALNAKHQPLKVHEDIVVFSPSASTYSKKGSMAYYPQMVEGTPYTSPKKKDGSHTMHGSISVAEAKKNPGTRYPRSVQRFTRERGHHPTQKPVALMEYLIKTYTNPGDTVLDFTMGSGTTGVAAGNLDRVFIGIERDEKYYGTAIARIWSEVTRAV